MLGAQRPEALLSRPPAGVEAMTPWFEAISYGLVLLEPYPLAAVESAVRAYRTAVREHGAAIDRVLDRGPWPAPPGLAAILRSDHRWFVTSTDQLDWHLEIVRRDDHGGNRQALGQYGRILTEAMRRHLAREAALGRPPTVPAPAQR